MYLCVRKEEKKSRYLCCRRGDAKVLLLGPTSYVIYAIFIYNLCRIVSFAQSTKVSISRHSISRLYKYSYCQLQLQLQIQPQLQLQLTVVLAKFELPPRRHVVYLSIWWAEEKCKCWRCFGQMEIICTFAASTHKYSANLST